MKFKRVKKEVEKEKSESDDVVTLIGAQGMSMQTLRKVMKVASGTFPREYRIDEELLKKLKLIDDDGAIKVKAFSSK